MTIFQNIKKHYAARANKSYNCWRNSKASHGSNAKRNMHKKILQWSIVQKNILAKNMIQYIKRNVVHNIFFATFIIIADPFNESE